MTGAAWIRARAVLRRHWRATVFLALFAGLAGGAAMTAWSYSRRAHTVVPRRLEAFSVPDGTFQSCPPGVDPSKDLAPCLAFDSNRAAFDGLIRSDHVAAAKLYVGFALGVTSEKRDEPQLILASAVADARGEIAHTNVTRGTTVDDLVGNEVVFGESTAGALDVGLDDELSVSVCEVLTDGGPVGCTDSTPVRIAGVSRLDNDILRDREAPEGLETLGTPTTFAVATTFEWWQEHSEGRTPYLTTAFRLKEGSTLADVRDELPSLLPGYTTLVTPYEDVALQAALLEATQLQGRTLFFVAAILLLAAVLFVGQALLRQVPRELSQHRTLTALGADRNVFLLTSLMRGLPVAVGAAIVAVVTAAVASVFGPSGLASRAEIDPGLRLDPLVLGLGAFIVSILIIAGFVGGAWRVVGAGTRTRRPRRSVPAALPPVVQAGVLLGRGRGGMRSMMGAAFAIVVAVVAVVWAGCLVASLDRLIAAPERYGASWDYGIGDFASAEDTQAAIDDLRANDVVTDAAILTEVGPLELDSLDPMFVLSLESLKGDLGPVIVEGRAPTADDEIALGPQTLADLDLEIGDTLDSLPILAASDDGETDGADAPSTLGPFRIVGTALISANDTDAGPGEGIIVTPAIRQAIDPGTTGEIVVAVDHALSDDVVLSNLIEHYGMTLTIPTPQAEIRNLDVISTIPGLIAALVAALGFGAMAHSLMLNVRRSRGTLAVLRTLGFTSGQVVRAVTAQANGLALAAVALGVPLGIIAGDWSWSARASELGVQDSTVVPVWVAVLAAIGAFVGVNAAALWPGFRAGRADLGATLRSE